MTLTRFRAAALAAHPGTPLITDCTQGRVELSHVTFDNWVTKTVNFLRMEAEVGEGSTIALDLPLHWSAAVWTVAVWEAGCDLSLGEGDLHVGGPEADICVSTDPWGMAPAPTGASSEWFFPADVRGMPDALILPTPSPGSVLGYTAEVLAQAALGYAQEVGLDKGGRLQVLEPASDLRGVLALIAAALVVDASVLYGPSAEDVTAQAG